MNKAKILLVDDEKLILKAFKRLLDAEGYYVKTAISGTEAVNCARQEKFDIVYTDLVMPDMNGVEVCREIKKMQPNAEIILISGHPEQITRYKQEFINAGGREEFLRKPVLGMDLIRKTESVLSELEIAP